MERNTNTLYPLRFIAAIMVVLYHYTPPAIRPTLEFFIRNGGEAVNFFFFISGFVMVIANAKYFKSDDASFGRNDFLVKRLARIYPLYVFAILMLAVFHYGIQSIDTASVKYRLPFELLGIQRWLYAGSFNYPGWTISCEFFFYLLFPVAIVYLRKNYARYKSFVWAYFILALIVTNGLYYATEKHMLGGVMNRIAGILYLHPVFEISTFLLGTLCGKVYLDNKSAFFHKTWNNRIAVLLCAVIIFYAKYAFPDNFGLVRAGILSPVYFVFIMSVTSFSQSETKLFNSKLSLFLGEISYGIYIVQYPVYIFYIYYIHKVVDWPTLLLFIACLVAVASITFYLIEKPCKKMILSFYQKRTATARIGLNAGI